ncbi:hypothetical protein JT306_06220 [Salmonella enterica subsp. enterica serovar Kentucky]|nr:hypothetical protein [Salmonella enterica subsp. enterica serovar Kentucky]
MPGEHLARRLFLGKRRPVRRKSINDDMGKCYAISLLINGVLVDGEEKGSLFITRRQARSYLRLRKRRPRRLTPQCWPPIACLPNGAPHPKHGRNVC